MDLYEVLGLRPGATLGDIKRAYRRLARRYHPDINPGDGAAEVRFRQVTLAYETLVDPERRVRYDETGSIGAPVEASSIGFEGFDFSVEAAVGERASTFGDLFADVLRRDEARPGQAGPERGADLHVSVRASFGESMHGATRAVTVSRLEACRGCGGSGLVRAPETPCLHCGGAGIVRSSRGHMVFSRSCPHCGGEGRRIAAPCRACGGEGVETRVGPVSVPIPAGVADGARMRLPGQGNAGRRGGGAGDLLVTFHVDPHPCFRREGLDLHVVVPVAIHEAALGVRIEVPAPDGPARLRVPPGCQSGQRLRLRGRGVPAPDGETRGDFIVELRLVLPPVLDERSKALLREFGRINSEDVRRELMTAASSGIIDHPGGS